MPINNRNKSGNETQNLSIAGPEKGSAAWIQLVESPETTTMKTAECSKEKQSARDWRQLQEGS